MYRKIFPFLFVLVFILSGCGASKGIRVKKYFDDNFFDRQFTGFALYDPVKDKMLYTYQADKYFTPASNTKIFTLYTGLQLLPDSIPALHYATSGDTLYIEGTGNPAFLHSYFKDRSVLDFLEKREEPIALYSDNFYDDRFGPGWSWGDYPYYYSPERGAFPMYGNVLTVYKNRGELKAVPEYFQNALKGHADPQRPRNLRQNTFYIPQNLRDTLEIPFILSPDLTRQLLSDTLKKKIHPAHTTLPTTKKTLYSKIAADSLYQRMMYVSDNFLAEQILLMSAAAVSDSLNGKKAIDYVLDRFLPGIPQKPRWVDGSGLSRYNLFTPESIVYVLNRLYHEQPRERLFRIFAAGGQSGTLKGFYKGENGIPYLYAKSGTLSNNHNLSGYLLTRSGRVLIFSYMNNHYMQPTGEVKKRMETLLRHIRDHY
ncbi:D-alanyl-D-alanine carboxypeptidase [Sinomicrobium sp. M5D2P17]